MRCVVLARAVKQRWPAAQIAFAASRAASYATAAGFPVRWFERSPTFETRAVASWLQEMRPTIVVFDGTARRAQLRLAQALGARTIFISARPSGRRKIMRWRHLRCVDEIWFTQPPMLEPPLTWWERLKLRWSHPVVVKYPGPIFEPVEAERQARMLAACGAHAGELIVLCPGGGALGGDGSVLQLFVEVANTLASRRGVSCVVVAGAQETPKFATHPGVIVLGLLANGELMDLLAAARLAITNGGALVAQAVALRVLTLGVPVMSDQPPRLRALQALELIAVAPLSAPSIVQAAEVLLDDEAAAERQRRAMRRHPIDNGLIEALRSIERGVGRIDQGLALLPHRSRPHVRDSAAALRVCFIPVSGPRGAGEFMRCVILARAFRRHWPAAEIAFAISREAPYADALEFPVRLVKRSPTFETRAISEWLREVRPSIVVFDGTARRAQIEVAAALGAHIIFISSRPSGRRKIMRWGHLRSIDEVWLTQPRVLEPPLNWLERAKLRWAQPVTVKFLGPIFEPVDPARQARMLSLCETHVGDLVLLCPGGGALGGDGSVIRIFVAVANALADGFGVRCIVVAGAQGMDDLEVGAGVRVLGLVANGELMDLLSAARLAITNGGDLIAQALALRVPVLGVPVMPDQPRRLRALLSLQLIEVASLDVPSIVRAATELLDSEAARRRQRAALEDNPIDNGLFEALRSLEAAVAAVRAPSIPSCSKAKAEL